MQMPNPNDFISNTFLHRQSLIGKDKALLHRMYRLHNGEKLLKPASVAFLFAISYTNRKDSSLAGLRHFFVSPGIYSSNRISYSSNKATYWSKTNVYSPDPCLLSVTDFFKGCPFYQTHNT